jgi:hypothetical protein
MESGGSPCPVVDTTKTTNRSLGKRLCTSKQRRHGLACTGRVAAGTLGFWSIRDRSRPWRARRRPGSPRAPPRGRRAPRRPWRSRFARRRARGGGHWRTPPSPPPRPRAPWSQSSEPAACKRPSGGQQAHPRGAPIAPPRSRVVLPAALQPPISGARARTCLHACFRRRPFFPVFL